MKKPEYQGQALSAIRKLSNARDNIPNLWMWRPVWRWLSPEENIEHSSDAMNNLLNQGWKRWNYNTTSIESQLGNIIRLTKMQENGESWADTILYKLQGKDMFNPAPVMLTFSISKDGSLKNDVPMLNPLPLPQYGEYAIVEDSEVFYVYHVMDLPLEARQRWISFGEAIKKLSSPLDWAGFTDHHLIASNQLAYEHKLAELNAQLLPENKKIAFVVIEITELQAAHDQIEAIHKQLAKETWLEEWSEIGLIAHDLARDYFFHHIKIKELRSTGKSLAQTPEPEISPTTSEPISEMPSTTPEPISEMPTQEDTLQILDTPMPIEPKKKRGRRPHAPVTGIVAKGKDTITIRSDTLNREIINALRDGGTYNMYKDQLIAEHSHMFTLQKDKGQIIITLRGLAGEGFETILSAVNTLGDGCIDTFIAVQAVAIDKNGTDHIRTPIEMSPDDILEVCGKKKSHGSYTPHQRAEVIAHLKTLSQAHVIATLPGRPARGKRDKGTFIKVEGALIDLLSWKIGEYKTITGEEVWERRSISVGQWVTMVPGMSDRTAIMLRKLLAYSAKNERYQKRLGLYLTFMFRINATKGGSFDVTTAKLLEGAGIVPDRKNPGRFKDAIEYALNKLQEDGAIGPYSRLIDSSPEGQEREQAIQEMGKGWWDQYDAQMWRFNTPDRSREQYKLLKRPDQQGDEIPE